jgi:hypothetical protein
MTAQATDPIPTAPPAPGTTLEAVQRVLPTEAMGTFPGRALLALSEGTPAWRGDVFGWRLRLLLRGWWSVWRARWVAARCFDFRLAFSRWRSEPDGTAVAQLDGIWLGYGHGQMALLVACPKGASPHATPVSGLTDLAELLLSSQTNPDAPPWTCPPDCPTQNPVSTVMVDLASRRPREGR